MDVFYNMSAPPKSNINYEIKKLGKQILFDPNILIDFFKTDKENLISCIKLYCEKNKDLLANYKKPTSYMIGKIYNESDKNYEIEQDINLIILVLSSTYGVMYSPVHEISYNHHRYENKIIFLKEEMFND